MAEEDVITEEDLQPTDEEPVAAESLDDALGNALSEIPEQATEEAAAEPEQAAAPEEADETPEETPEEEVPELHAPTSWTQADREKFHTMPRESQQFVLDRIESIDADFTRRQQDVSNQLTALDQATQIMQAGFGPQFTADYVPQAMRQYIGWSQALRGPDKVNAAKRLLTEFGIGLEELESDIEVDPVVQATNQRIQALEQRLQQQTLQSQQQTTSQYDKIYQDFCVATDGKGNLKHPHLSKVEQDMVAMVQANAQAVMADPRGQLEKIYDRACWANDEVRGQLMAKQRAPKVPEKPQRNVSTKGGDTKGALPDKPSLEQAINHSLDGAGLH